MELSYNNSTVKFDDCEIKFSNLRKVRKTCGNDFNTSDYPLIEKDKQIMDKLGKEYQENMEEYKKDVCERNYVNK